jgi:hypothetical protein
MIRLNRPLRAGLAGLALLSAPAWAQDSMDDVMGGFEDIDTIADSARTGDTQASTPVDWVWSGSLSAGASYNLHDHRSSTGTDYSGLSRLRLRANLGLDRKFVNDWLVKLDAYTWRDLAYAINDEDYTRDVLDEYESDVDIQDAYVHGKLGEHWDLKLGRQVAVWGFADNLRVLDVLNPLDNLEPGIADIEDLRRPVGMLRLNYFSGPWQYGIYAIPEQRFSRNPPFGSDFYAITDANGNAVKFREEKPDDFESSNYALSAKARFSGWDLTFNAARLWNDEPYLDPTAFDVNAPGASSESFNDAAVLRHSRLNLFGFGLQMTRGSWIFKQEFAALDKLWLTDTGPVMVSGPLPDLGGLPVLGGLPLPVLPIPLPVAGTTVVIPNAVSEHAQYSLLLGLEYFGLASTSIGVEIAARYLDDFNDQLAASGYLEKRTESSLRVTRDFINERLRATFIAILFDQDNRFLGKDGGALYRINGDYELGRNLQLSGGVVLYDGGNQAPFNAFEDNDRLFTEIRWSF